MDETTAPDRGEVLITELGTKFSDRYGDRSGIVLWWYDADRNMYAIRRKSGNCKYYANLDSFKSLTRIDLQELTTVPFVNESNNQRATDFRHFLVKNAKKNFEGIKIATSFIKRSRSVLNPKTNKSLKTVMWPPTAKVKTIPLPPRYPEGVLSRLDFWTYDPATHSALIRTHNSSYRIMDARDLMRFGESDIIALSRSQILTESPLFEEDAKEFMVMVATIIA